MAPLLLGAVATFVAGEPPRVAAAGCVDDSWEYDDECPGGEVRPGAVQRRRLCDEDWAYFAIEAGSRYRVETRRLRGGADTEIELWMANDDGCYWLLAADDDGGSGRGSRIELEAPPDGLGTSYATVVVRQAGGAYADGMEYELSVERLRRSYVVPVVAHASGVGGVGYRSDLRLTNPGPEAVAVDLVFTPTGPDGPGRRASRTVEIGPLGTVVLDDVVATAFGVEGVGSLLVHTSGADVVGGSTIRIEAGAGDVLQEVPLVPLEAAQLHQSRLFPLVNRPGVRTNVGFAAVLGERVMLELELWDAGWADVVARRTLAVPPLGHVQLNRVFERFGVGGREGVYQLEIRSVDGGAVVAYASTVHAPSGDATLVLGGDPWHRDTWRTHYVPLAAADLAATDVTVSVVVPGLREWTFLPEPGGGDEVWLELDLATGVNLVEDVGASFGLAGPGVLEIPTPYSRVVAATRRPHADSGGELGSAAAVILADERAARYPDPPWSGRGPRLVVAAADGSAGRRTSLGWVNPTDDAGRATVLLRSAAGEPLGRTSVALEPRRAGGLDDVFAATGAVGRRNAALEVEVVEGDAAVHAWIAVTDLATGDATFEAARPADEGWPRVHTVNLETGAFELGDAPQAVAIDRLPVEEFRATATATGDLGRIGLPVHAACSYVGADGEIRAAALGDGDQVVGIGGLSPFACVVPDWIDCSDNQGGVRITLTGGPHVLVLELDARDHCLLLDTLPEAFADAAPAPAYELRVVDSASRALPVLVLFRDEPTGALDLAALHDGDVLSGVAPFRLVGLVVDVAHVQPRIGHMSLFPLPRGPEPG